VTNVVFKTRGLKFLFLIVYAFNLIGVLQSFVWWFDSGRWFFLAVSALCLFVAIYTLKTVMVILHEFSDEDGGIVEGVVEAEEKHDNRVEL